MAQQLSLSNARRKGSLTLKAQEQARIDHWVGDHMPKQQSTDIPWHSMRNRPLTPREKQAVRQFYSGDYPVKSRYTERHPWHQQIAQWRIVIAEAVLGELGKALDAGCAAGEVVSTGREMGLDCSGFDICPDLFDICYPEVAEHLRIGTLAHIPYSQSDSFKTALSYDVIEHSPIDELERFPFELKRLGITQVACIISTDTLSEGHITIQDTDYYRDLFASAGYRMLDELTEALQDAPAPVAWNEEHQQVIWAPYNLSGSPQNGWNQTPGYLFFRSES